MLNKGGTMYIEDVQEVEWFEGLQETFDEVKESLDGGILVSVDLRYVKDRYDDLIFVIKRVDE